MAERTLKALLAFVVVACAAVLIREVSVEPYRCNIAERQLEAALRSVLDRPEVVAQREARRVLAEVQPLREQCPAATNLHMVAGLAHRILGDYNAAAEAYSEALRWDRRPEVYYNLGMTLLSAGKTEEAIPILARAAAFDPYMVWRIGDPEVANRVYQAVQPPGTPQL